MKLATLACLAALCLIGPGAHAAPGDAPRPDKAPAAVRTDPPRPDQPRAEPAKIPPVNRADPPRADAPKSEPAKGPPVQGARDRRRRSYAACNRASHQRGYHGGRRRRFLIRCRLGYERTRTPPSQAPAAAQPARKP